MPCLAAPSGQWTNPTNGSWHPTFDYHSIHFASSLLHTTVLIAAEVLNTICLPSYLRMTVLDVKSMFFQCPIHSNAKGHFTFTWNSIQYTFTHLPQDYHHSHTLTHGLLALVEISSTPDLSCYQYTNDILLGRPTHESVAPDMTLLVSALKEHWDLSIPPCKCQGPAQNVWVSLCAGTKSTPEIILQSILSLLTPSSKHNLQRF